MQTHFLKLGVVLVLSVFIAANNAMAQASDAAASAPTSKAVRKAQRKEARTKKNAELKKLEGAGYKPSEDQTGYPDNVQSAEKKAQP